MNPKIIFEDKEILVFDKPAGLVVNRSETTKGDTLQDFLDKKLEIESDGSEFAQRSGIVHRLDKETSGVLVVSKNSEAFEKLKFQFKERETKKTYVALVHGILKTSEGQINAPVGRLPWNRMRFGVLAGGREAVTFYKVLQIFEKKDLTLLELQPKTGRTHQIRVHLKHIGYPIFSDQLYSGRRTSREDRKVLARIFLHAQSLEFNHPVTEERVFFESALPIELSNLLKSL